MSSSKIRTNFVRISREFTGFYTNVTGVHPLICPNTQGTLSNASLHAPWPQATMVWVHVVISCPFLATPEPPLQSLKVLHVG